MMYGVEKMISMFTRLPDQRLDYLSTNYHSKKRKQIQQAFGYTFMAILSLCYGRSRTLS